MTAPIADPKVRKLREVRDLPSLTAYLRDELEWPIANWDIEDLVFDYTAAEVGLDAARAVKVKSIRRLRPLVADQPWGVFFLEFHSGELPITVLRRILRTLVIRKRAASRPDRPAWQMDDLLFISAVGPDRDRSINLAHFSNDGVTTQGLLRVVDWDEADTHFHMLRTDQELQKLRWREDGEGIEGWRTRWQDAFALEPRQVGNDAKKLATAMAELARRIRDKVLAAYVIEAKDGTLHELYDAFTKTLLHDASVADFADMYAQTITYGLFAAKNARPSALVLEDAQQIAAITNPFLGELLAQFTQVSGRNRQLDFDEFGVNVLIEMLNTVNLKAILDEWGRSKPGEDPVIHFYEDFLEDYNGEQKKQRGVFYTPRPVVSFIVRSLHELLQEEFQLQDGLASTETWGDMQAKFPDLRIPVGANENTHFVQVLDPAVGTGTFLVEVIDVIYRTMAAKWEKQGFRPMLDFERLWNEYVPRHLLPRLYGFELMMASYTIAHMKVGLKLAEFGYKFGAAERVHIYLTNTLEPAQAFSGQVQLWAPALAHEASSVNEVKANTAFTVVIGNPPYSGKSLNKGTWIRALLRSRMPDGADSYFRVDGADLGERNSKWLNDDYVKFVRYTQYTLARSSIGLMGMITPHGYLDAPTFRGMRQSLCHSFNRVTVLDLHGNGNRRERSPDESADDNVFDIQQGVAISLLSKTPGAQALVERGDLFGSRDEKYRRLRACDVELTPVVPVGPFYLLANAIDDAELYGSWPSLPRIFPTNVMGFQSHRDDFAVAISRGEVADRLGDLADPVLSDDDLGLKYAIRDTRDWSIAGARSRLRDQPFRRNLNTRCLYRPYDARWCILDVVAMDFPRVHLQRHMTEPNWAILSSRQQASPGYRHCFVSKHPASDCVISTKSREGNQISPIYLYSATGLERTSNVASDISASICEVLGATMALDGFGTLPSSVGPDAIAAYVYALMNAPSYRIRYERLLAVDFPRIPFTSDKDAFMGLARLGAGLVAVQLLETGTSVVALELSGLPNGGSTEVPVGDSRISVPLEAWEHSLGSHKPAQKWLKDRRGRTLTPEDVEHYKRIIGAITETIRIQNEIDEVIEAHGGWPAAFSAPAEEAK